MNERELASVGVAASSAETARGSVLWLTHGCRPAEGVRGAVRSILERAGQAAPVLRRLVPPPSTIGCAAHASTAEAVRAVGSAVAAGAVVGGVVDAAYAVVEARRDGLRAREGLVRVARSTGGGMVATAAGAGAALGLVAVVGPVAPAGLVVASFVGSMAARTLLRTGAP